MKLVIFSLFYIETLRNYQRKAVISHSKETLRKCVASAKAGNISMIKAQKQYCILYGTICKKMKNLHLMKQGRQPGLLMDFEEMLDKLTDWKVPFDRSWNYNTNRNNM